MGQAWHVHDAWQHHHDVGLAAGGDARVEGEVPCHSHGAHECAGAFAFPGRRPSHFSEVVQPVADPEEKWMGPIEFTEAKRSAGNRIEATDIVDNRFVCADKERETLVGFERPPTCSARAEGLGDELQGFHPAIQLEQKAGIIRVQLLDLTRAAEKAQEDAQYQRATGQAPIPMNKASDGIHLWDAEYKLNGDFLAHTHEAVGGDVPAFREICSGDRDLVLQVAGYPEGVTLKDAHAAHVRPWQAEVKMHVWKTHSDRCKCYEGGMVGCRALGMKALPASPTPGMPPRRPIVGGLPPNGPFRLFNAPLKPPSNWPVTEPWPPQEG